MNKGPVTIIQNRLNESWKQLVLPGEVIGARLEVCMFAGQAAEEVGVVLAGLVAPGPLAQAVLRRRQTGRLRPLQLEQVHRYLPDTTKHKYIYDITCTC